MGNAHIAGKTAHIAGAKYIAHQPHALMHVEGITLGRGNAGGVLTPVLQQLQPIVEELINRSV
jgi:hypothetical protein